MTGLDDVDEPQSGTLANGFLASALRKGSSVAERIARIVRSHALPLVAQASQLGISRGVIYYLARAVFRRCLAILPGRRVALALPVRRQPDTAQPAPAGAAAVARLHIATLMKRIRIEPIYRRPNKPSDLLMLRNIGEF